MTSSAEIVQMLNTLTQEMQELKIAIGELQENNASSAVSAERMYKTLNAKFDIFKNLEPQSRDTIQPSASASRKLTRPAFFKKIFTEDREKYLNILYTQEEVDAAFEDPDVIAKKKPAEKASKVVTILYTKHIKANSPEDRASAFASYYDQMAI